MASIITNCGEIVAKAMYRVQFPHQLFPSTLSLFPCHASKTPVKSRKLIGTIDNLKPRPFMISVSSPGFVEWLKMKIRSAQMSLVPYPTSTR